MWLSKIGSKYWTKWNWLLVAAALIAIALQATGCGKEEFLKQNFAAAVSPVGYQVLPAKVDILFVTDNSGSGIPTNAYLQGQLSALASQMQSQNWDYHVAAIPIAAASAPSINQVLVNSAFNSPTLLDGTPRPSSQIVPSSYAVTSSSQLLMLYNTYIGNGTADPTFSYIYSALVNNYAHFSRPDALLAIAIITNGEESSGGSVSTWANSIVSASGRRDRSQVQVFSLASQGWVSPGSGTCRGAGALSGARYNDISTLYLPGRFYDFCANEVSVLFNAIASRLIETRRAYVTGYIVLSEAPVPSSIQITKNTGQSVPQDAVNGWTYIGRSTVNTIVEPYPMNEQTGYVIQLNGTGRLYGSETANVQYQRQ